MQPSGSASVVRWGSTVDALTSSTHQRDVTEEVATRTFTIDKTLEVGEALMDRSWIVKRSSNDFKRESRTDSELSVCDGSGITSDLVCRDKDPSARPLHTAMLLPSRRSTGDVPTRLTLSAFRRPENTIRLTNSDPSRRLSNEYNLYGRGCHVLGHGAFSTVRSALRMRDGQKVAVKTIAKHDALRSRRLRVSGRHYMEEWEILRRFERHPNVINLMDVFETDEEIHLVLEYCRGGELFDAIRGRWGFGNTGRGLTEAQAAFITSQILTALADLHEAGIVHRDLKPENILISGSSPICVKLCDFGMARATVPAPSSDLDEGASASTDGEDSPVTPAIGRSFSIVGSNFYIAPEVVDGEGYSTSVDLYSLGVTLYLLLCGFPPVFTCEEGSKVLFPVDPDISEPAKQLVEKLLSSDPDERITAREALAHPWIQAHCSLCSTEMNPTSSRDANFSLHHHQTLATSDRHQGLEIMRQSLQQAIGKRGPCQIPLQLRSDKRVRRRASSCILAMADLYQEVTAPNAFEPCLVPTDSSSGRRVAGNDSRRSSLASRIVSGG